MRIHRIFGMTVSAFLLLAAWARPALAQQAGPGGPLVIQPIENHVVVAPEVKITDLEGETGTLVGATVGWLKDGQLLLGGAGYGLVDYGHHNNTPGFGYGGFVIGWYFDPDRPVSVSAKALLGFGGFTNSHGVVPVPYCATPNDPACVTVNPNSSVDNHGNDFFHFHNGFAVLEPEMDVHAKISKHAQITGGIGYRIAGAYYGGYYGGYYYPYGGHGYSIHGVTATISMQFALGK